MILLLRAYLRLLQHSGGKHAANQHLTNKLIAKTACVQVDPLGRAVIALLRRAYLEL